mgnify:CR=1 FL=1
MAFDPLNLTDLGADQIVTEATMLALYNNPVEIAKRGVSAPWLNGVGASVQLAGAGNWVVPADVTRVRATLVGGGGACNGAAGGTTSFGAISAGGGGGGSGGTNPAGGSPGSAVGGDVNLPGEPGRPVYAGSSRSAIYVTRGRGGDTLGANSFGGGGSGGTVIKVLSVNPGDVIAYSVGTGGVGTGFNPGEAGTAGTIILEY